VKHVLDPLKHIPGVRRAMLFSHDGVPIVHFTNEEQGDVDRRLVDTVADVSAFAGMASVLLSETRRSIDPMSWGSPTRLVLAATRGTVILLTTERLNISVELSRGMSPEELRLPMESVVARIDRATSCSPPRAAVVDVQEDIEGPPGIFPAAEEGFDVVSESKLKAGNEVPNTTTDS
jgi:predicted regulator of Ras-like GTPase activity (Roadblock/LC7/MglB family)